MLRKPVSLWLALTTLAAIFYFVRQRALSDLRSGSDSLRRQVEAQRNNAPEPVQAAPSNSSITALTTEERNELLRLRSQVPSLRNDIAAASNRVAEVNRPPAPPRPSGPKPAPNSTAMDLFQQSEASRSAQELAAAMKRHLQEHSWQMPDDLAQVQGATQLPEETIQRFELIRRGTMPDPSSASYLLLAREKEPRQLSDGTWIRLYLYANGLRILGPLPNKPPVDDSEFVRNHEATFKAVTERQSAPR